MSNITMGDILTPISNNNGKSKSILDNKQPTEAELKIRQLKKINASLDDMAKNNVNFKSHLEKLKKELPVLESQGRINDRNHVLLIIQETKKRISAKPGNNINPLIIGAVVLTVVMAIGT